MRAKKSFLIALFLCTWSLISYFLLMRQTDTDQDARHPSHSYNDNNRRKRDDFLKQLNRLETNIYEENELHDHLVKRLVEIVRLKNEKFLNKNGQRSDAASNGLANKNNRINDTPIKHNNDGVVDKNVIVSYDNNNSLDGIGEAEAGGIGADGEPFEHNDQAILDAHLRKLNKKSDNLKGPIIAVLVFACNRISVRNCLDDLVRYRPNAQQFPIIVSQVNHFYNSFH